MSLGTKSKALAKTFLDQAINEQVSSGVTPGSRNITLHDAADSWFADRARPLRGLSKVTIREYRTFVKQLKEIAPEELVADEVRAADIRTLLDLFQDTFQFSPSTVKKRFGALMMLFNWLFEEDLVRLNPVKKSDAPFATAKQLPPWTGEQYLKLQEQLFAVREDPETSEYWVRASQLLIDLTKALWLSGMRSIQAYRMRWEEDIDLEKMIWLVRSPRKNKGGEKLKPIHQSLSKLLLRRKLLGDVGPFPQPTCLYAWKTFKLRYPEFKGMSLHQCRSRVSTAFHEMGESEVSRKMLGHTTLAAADLYDWTSIEHYRGLLNRISE
ncbi:MAG: hypothetical protein COA70_13195 [Planctomycetota bacterium]|nr:MAG: hypothetical protein COA70_13195 [Planctomycetota bacterium]